MRLRDLLPGGRTEVDAFLSLGSNLGDRDDHLRRAIAAIDALDRVGVVAVSGVYETEPVGDVEQDTYLNTVVRVRTDLRAAELLAETQRIEAAHGRDRSTEERWGPRPLDIDIVLFGDEVSDDPGLTLPHPRMHERAFVLVPLLEVHPGGALPDGTRLTTLVTRLAPIEGVALAYRYDRQPGSGPVRPAGPNSPDPILAADWRAPGGAPDDIPDLPGRGTDLTGGSGRPDR